MPSNDPYIRDEYGNVIRSNPDYVAPTEPPPAEPEIPINRIAPLTGTMRDLAEPYLYRGAGPQYAKPIGPQPPPPPQKTTAKPKRNVRRSAASPQLPEDVGPDGPKAEMAEVPPDGPKAEMLPQEPVASEEVLPDGPKAEMLAEQEAKAAQDAQEMEEIGIGLAARGVSGPMLSYGMQWMKTIKDNILDVEASAAALRGQAGMKKAEYASTKFKEEQAAYEELGEGHKQALADLADRAQGRMASMLELDQQIMAGQVNPAQTWTNKSIAEKAFIGFSAGLYRALQVTQGRIGGSNPVIDAFQRAVKMDMQAQEANINKLLRQKAGIRADQVMDMQFTQMKQASLAASAVHRISGAIAKMNADIQSGAVPDELQAKYLSDLAGLEKLKQGYMDSFGNSVANMYKARADYIKKTGRGKRSGKAPGGAIKALAPGQLNIGVFGASINGQSVIDLGDKQIAEEDLGALKARYAQLQALTNILHIGVNRQRYGARARELMEQQIKIILNKHSMAGGRAVSDADIELYEAALGEKKPGRFFSLVSEAATTAKLTAAAEDAAASMRETISVRLRPEDAARLTFIPPRETISHLVDDDAPGMRDKSTRQRIAEQFEFAETPEQNFAAMRETIKEAGKRWDEFTIGQEGQQELNDYRRYVKNAPLTAEQRKTGQSLVKKLESILKANAIKVERRQKAKKRLSEMPFGGIPGL